MNIQRFYINDSFIDLSRSLIVYQEQEISVEPKMLKVLLLLAENAGEVVTHQTIKEQIWPNVEVVPNALQRCIAQLRKALGDDAKAQQVIKTHPKVGYSLVGKVRWSEARQNETKLVADKISEKTKSTVTQGTALHYVYLCVAMVLCIALWAFLYTDNATKPNVYSHIKQLTQSDENDLFPIFSPDGEYLVFSRNMDFCQSHIWAKHLASGQEFQLTEQAANYGRASFSKDGGELAVALQKSCLKKVENDLTEDQRKKAQQCWSIQTMDFAQAINGQTDKVERYQCSENPIELVYALDNNRYSFLSLQDNRYQLAVWDGRQSKLASFHQQIDKRIYFYAFHGASQRFAVISRDKDNTDWLTILDLQGNQLSQVAIERPAIQGTYQFVEPSFAQGGKSLIYSNGAGAFTLSFDGKVSQIELPENGLFFLSMHPNKHLLAGIRGQVDSDIASISLNDSAASNLDSNSSFSGEESTKGNETSVAFNQVYLPYPSLSRTTAQEYSPKFQPNGELIAFVSNRTGEDQIWLLEQGQARKLTSFEGNSVIDVIFWSPDGKSIAFVQQDSIQMVDLAGKLSSVKPDVAVRYISQWYRDNTMLVIANGEKVRELFSLDLTTGETESLGYEQLEKAWYYQEGLLLLDRERNLWRVANDQSSSQETDKQLLAKGARLAILPSDNVSANNSNSAMNNHSLYWINHEQRVLHQLDLSDLSSKPLMTLKPKTSFISDIRDNLLLTEQYIAAKKEVVVVE